MNQKKAKALRRLAKYNPEDDPIRDRKYSVLVTSRAIDTGKQKIARPRTGHMLVSKGNRLRYRQIKKLYKERQYEM